jgi:transposase-like protein
VTRKLPPDAFDYYVGLGPGRSYVSVAQKFGVTKRAVTKLAARETWQERLGALEQKAREQADSRIVETLEGMNTRHLKMLRLIQGKALQALQSMPILDAVAAAKALDMAIKQERVVRGEPGDRQAVDVEAIIRRENERWLMRDAGGGADDAGG